MDLAALKNLDIKDLLNKIKGAGAGNILQDKKILIKFGIGFGSILIFLIIYYVFVSPVINEQKAKINIMDENQNKIDEYLANIDTLEASVKKLEPEYKKSSKLFHSRKEVEDLYQNISNFAMTNGLAIINIQKGEPTAVNNPVANQMSNEQTENTQNEQTENTQENQEGSQVLYYKIPVNYKITGTYLGYLKFRRALSKSPKVINFDKEIITVEANNTSGMILSEGTISIVGLPDEYKK
jgi:Tfp pilus assembly protein PilO